MTTASRKPRPKQPVNRHAVKKENAYAPPTEKQEKFARSLALQRGYPKGYPIAAAWRDMTGKNKWGGKFNRQDMSRLIDWLNQDDDADGMAQVSNPRHDYDVL